MRVCAVVVGSLAATALLLEVTVRGLAAGGVQLGPEPPKADARFWDGQHETFGVWHRPNAMTRHTTACFDVGYQTNAIGARDRQRSSDAAGPRVVVLGDSFVEGWGIEVDQRLSDILEAQTGIEHINLAMAHFGPYQASLAYREFAPRFEHDAVLVGLAPVNDFVDLDFEVAKGAPAYHFRYRPYLTGTYPDYGEFRHRENPVARFFRQNSYAWNAVTWSLHLAGGGDAYMTPLQNEDGYYQSFFHDYSQAQFDLLRASLERILGDADGRPVAVFLIPSQRDFARFGQSGEGRLAEELRAFGKPHGMRVVDLLPAMFDGQGSWYGYFLTCDYHWNQSAHAVAAGILERELGSFLYADRSGENGLPDHPGLAHVNSGPEDLGERERPHDQ
jgi:hypothetical protein